jgi:Tfp pilus assembly protein PilO
MNPQHATRTLWHLDVLGGAVCAALTFALVFGGVRPLLEHRDARRLAEEDVANARMQADRQEASLAALQHRLDEAKRQLAGSDLQLQPVSTVNQHVARVSALAVEGGLRLDDIQTGAVAAAAHYQAVPIFMAGTGSYRDAALFLRRLGGAFPDTSVSLVKLTGNGAAPTAPGKFHITLLWHAAPGLAAAVAAPAPGEPASGIARKP